MNELRQAAPWAGPFLVFVVCLSAVPTLFGSHAAGQIVWLAAGAASVVYFSRSVLDLRPSRPVGSVAVGVALFLVWIGPDTLLPGWRSSVLFQNSIMGHLSSSLAQPALADPLVLALRSLRAILLVPVVEELFWRGWLMRWLEDRDIAKVELGHYHATSFWIVAALFALEHGPYWDVGFLAGAGYNWWMVRTKRVGDLILAHAVTNACLCGYVIAFGRWEYWL